MKTALKRNPKELVLELTFNPDVANPDLDYQIAAKEFLRRYDVSKLENVLVTYGSNTDYFYKLLRCLDVNLYTVNPYSDKIRKVAPPGYEEYKVWSWKDNLMPFNMVIIDGQKVTSGIANEIVVSCRQTWEVIHMLRQLELINLNTAQVAILSKSALNARVDYGSDYMLNNIIERIVIPDKRKPQKVAG